MDKKLPEWLKQKGKDCSVGIFVQAAAKETKIVGEHGSWLKVKVEGQRIEGQANESLLDFLSEYFGIKKSDIILVRGRTSKFKHVTIQNMKAEEILSKLDENFSQRLEEEKK